MKAHKKADNRYSEIYYQNHSKKRRCKIAQCKEKTIDTHIVQKSRFLRPLADSNGQLYESDFDFFNRRQSFKLKSYRQSLRFEGFCSEHDQYYKEIEGESEINFSDYRTQLLLTYRGFLMEVRKQEVSLETNRQIEKEYPGYFIVGPKIEVFERAKSGNQLIDSYFEKDLKLGGKWYSRLFSSKHFEFHHFTIKNIGVVTSAFFGKYVDGETTAHLVCILPYENKTEVLFGYAKVNNWKTLRKQYANYRNLAEDELIKKISDLFILQIETWAVSHKYASIIREKGKDISELIRRHLDYETKPETVDFNLFEQVPEFKSP